MVDILNRRIYDATIIVEEGKIVSIEEGSGAGREGLHYLLPGFIDAHVHIESSMLVPSQFARLAVVHGTVATVSDPHEIANACGVAGVQFMIRDGNTVPFKFNFGAPGCVPATLFETAGAAIGVADINDLLKRDEIKYLTEMMNFPGVLNDDEEVLQKIAVAKKWGKPVDGHAPGLRGAAARKYIDAGISTDHECFTAGEALDKLGQGMKIIIREGSAAKNFDALVDLLKDHPDELMFCSDDKHPDSLVEGHINLLCKRAVAKGIDVFHVLKAACINPVLHYKLDVGLLKVGDPADFIVVKDLENFEVLKTYVNGILVAEDGASKICLPVAFEGVEPLNNFNCTKKKVEDFEYPVTDKNTSHVESLHVSKHSLPKIKDLLPGTPKALRTTDNPVPALPVIEALDGQLITNKLMVEPKIAGGKIVSDVSNDILKIVVVNRYYNAPAAVAFIKNFGLKEGAIASSVAHDSHNIIAVGVDDVSICGAVNLIIEGRGGVSLIPYASPASFALGAPSPEEKGSGKVFIEGSSSQGAPQLNDEAGLFLPLPVAGLMSAEDGYVVAEKYKEIDAAAKGLGSTLSAPFMTLSFMALLVIPHLKLSDKGLFDGDRFALIGK